MLRHLCVLSCVLFILDIYSLPYVAETCNNNRIYFNGILIHFNELNVILVTFKIRLSCIIDGKESTNNTRKQCAIFRLKS
jgi:hypothetical protein